VILHDGIKTIQYVFFSVFFKKRTKSCFFLKKQKNPALKKITQVVVFFKPGFFSTLVKAASFAGAVLQKLLLI